MAITNDDIKLFQAQDNSDNENGGGRRTNVEIADGQVNNLFADISRIDSVNGNVSLRKIFPVVDTDSRDVYYGAHAILRKTSTDEKVTELITYTNSPDDVREDAQNKIEAYVVPSFEAPFYLYGNLIAGTKAVTVLQNIVEEVPSVGEVYLLKFGVVEEYFRVADIESKVIPFTYQQGTYERRRVIITTEQPIENNFTGSVFHPDGQTGNTTDIYATQVANAAKFYGTKTLSNDALVGATDIQVDTIFEQLVPASTQQTPLINREALRQSELIVSDPSVNNLNITKGVSGAENEVVNLGYPITPGSLTTSQGYDDGNGNYIKNSTGLPSATINYIEGVLTGTYGVSGGVGFNFRPATVFDTRVQFSESIVVTQENQGSVYILNVSPVPSPSDTYIDYRTNGKWVRIPSNFDGTLGNDPSIGAGLINDNGDGTATISVTLGANPDLESTVIFSWGSDTFVESIIQYANDNKDTWVEIPLGNTNIDPTSLVIDYIAVYYGGNTTLTFDANGKCSLPTKELEAFVDAVNGIVYIKTTDDSPGLPTWEPLSPNPQINIQYNYADEPTSGQAGELTIINNPSFISAGDYINYTFSIGETVEVAGLRLTFRANPHYTNPDPSQNNQYGFDVELVSDADGVLRRSGGGNLAYGTVNVNGDIAISIPTKAKKIPIMETVERTRYGYTGGAQTYTVSIITGYETSVRPLFYVSDNNFQQLQYRTDVPATFLNTYDESLIFADVAKVKIQTLEQCIGDILFTYSGYNRQMAVKSDNNVYADSTQVGTFNRQTGVIEFVPRDDHSNFLPTFSQIYSNNLPNGKGVREVTFRTSTDDLVTSSFIMRYSTVNGTFVATTDANGTITGTDIDSTVSNVDTSTGAAFVVFTADVDPSNIKYDAVAETTLPLDPAIIGLNPVRLPPNGKVPVFDAGRTLVIFEEQETDIGTPTAGSTVTLSRSGQAYIEVIDVNGQRLDYGQFTADRDAGSVTFADPLSLIDRNGDPLTTPCRVVDRIEDMALCTSAEITGYLGLSAPLTHNFPADTTKVASALLWGNIGARIFNMFSQQSFDVWSDTPTRDPIAAQYDNVNFPMQINNKDSRTGRWAAVFTSSTTVNIQEETLGVVLSNVPISSDIAPINPATTQPYFVILTGGWGSGWVNGNVLRWNTESGSENCWIIRTVQSGALTEAEDSIEIEIRGDAN